jgi:hypothetical protein
MKASLQSIFNEHFAQYRSQHRLPLRALRAASCISDCGTPRLGGRLMRCPQEHVSEVRYNSCRHRSCPRCAAAPRQAWLATQATRMLPCEHYHVVFTLPHELHPLWEFNRVKLNQMLLDSARQSLLELCADPRFMGATPGLLMALHTWGRTLSRHPHVHCLVTAGGLDSGGRWQACRQGYLVPVRALQALFRGKLLYALRVELQARRLELPQPDDGLRWSRYIAALYRKHWNIHIGERYEHGRGVMLYLARYVKGGPLSADRVLRCVDGHVSLRFTDHRDSRAKTLRLHAHEFIGRVLTHAPPRGQHMVRHCGLYASQAKAQRDRCRQLLVPTADPVPLLGVPLACHDFGMRTPIICPRCKLPLQTVQSLLPAHRSGEFSIQLDRRAQTPTGPTLSWSGHPTAAASQALRRRSWRRRAPLN